MDSVICKLQRQLSLLRSEVWSCFSSPGCLVYQEWTCFWSSVAVGLFWFVAGRGCLERVRL
jgi:hypothetical protein